MLKLKKPLFSMLLILAAALLLLQGCAGWRPAKKPELEPPPDSFINDSGSIDSMLVELEYREDPWWLLFNDKSLDSLMGLAFSENLVLEQAVARLDQSRAGLTAARSSWFPFINAQGSITESDKVEEPDQPAMFEMEIPRYSAGITATYELDVWGKLSANRGAAKADFLAGWEDLRALTLTMSAQVARAYYGVIALRNQYELLSQTVGAYQNSYDLVMNRYRRGVAPSLDVYQAETNLAGAQARLAQVEAAMNTTENSFAILLAGYPRTGIVPGNAEMPVSVKTVPPGVPSELIGRRPDVRGSLYRLVASDKRAAEAVASRLPGFTVTGTITGSDDDIDKLSDPQNMIWTAIGNITMPLFQGGRLKANSDRAKAAWRGSLAAYRQTVLTAYREVEDALISARLNAEYVTGLERQVEAAEASLRLANDNYLRGVGNYLPVLTAQTLYFNSRSNLISARQEHVNIMIDLAVSAGGGWTDMIIEEQIITE